ncbi:nucleotidyltransferase [Marinihelvus fidelis]|uniref:Nucleotidyltransferase n=1 Tax=Marinihelvus fidelis TaxID=2613842 RepID=A0A5N0T8L9_9GAMM|nr:nucleotidyltransferase [Marinihelvus fidelis]KAA9131272.1 nucleotidyltransferase [Marinihelvus fidelis]
MPRRKRTRTTSIDRQDNGGARVSRSMRKLQMLRRDVAIEAARIMATEGQHNFKMAKRKAAERIGVNPRVALPSNIEVEEALRAYQGFYGGESHSEQLQSLRATAAGLMRNLESYRPRLVGPVLDGTADSHSRISLQLFNDPPDMVILYLLEIGVPFHQEQRRIRWHDGSFRDIELLVTEFEGVSVELALFGTVDLRQAPPSPVDGRPQKRAGLPEVEELLAA